LVASPVGVLGRADCIDFDFNQHIRIYKSTRDNDHGGSNTDISVLFATAEALPQCLANV
jgi:hypothetical protein